MTRSDNLCPLLCKDLLVDFTNYKCRKFNKLLNRLKDVLPERCEACRKNAELKNENCELKERYRWRKQSE